MSNYLETNDEKFAIQIGNFGSKIGVYQALFGLTPLEVEGAEEDAAYFLWIVSNLEKIDTYKRNWTSFKNIARKGALNVSVNAAPDAPVLETTPTIVAPNIQFRYTTLVNRIKAHPNYTVAIGRNLGITSSGTQNPDFDTAQPSLKVVMRAGKVNLDWKKGIFDGIVIEKDSGSGFVFLNKDLRPNFIDNSPLPAQGQSAIWKYRAMYLFSDEQVGLWSDVVTTTVSG